MTDDFEWMREYGVDVDALLVIGSNDGEGSEEAQAQDEAQGLREALASEQPEGDEEAEVGFPEVEDATEVNRHALAEHGQSNHSLVRPEVLAGALGRAENHVAYTGDLPQAAAALCHGIAQGQAFEDGNKRTAYHLTRAFLEDNGMGGASPADFDDEELADHIVGYAEGTHTMEDTAELFRRRLGIKKDARPMQWCPDCSTSHNTSLTDSSSYCWNCKKVVDDEDLSDEDPMFKTAQFAGQCEEGYGTKGECKNSATTEVRKGISHLRVCDEHAYAHVTDGWTKKASGFDDAWAMGEGMEDFIEQVKRDKKDDIDLYEGMNPEDAAEHVFERHDEHQTHPINPHGADSDEELMARHDALGPHEHLGARTRMVYPTNCPGCESSNTLGRYQKGGWREYVCKDCGTEFKSQLSKEGHEQDGSYTNHLHEDPQAIRSVPPVRDRKMRDHLTQNHPIMHYELKGIEDVNSIHDMEHEVGTPTHVHDAPNKAVQWVKDEVVKPIVHPIRFLQDSRSELQDNLERLQTEVHFKKLDMDEKYPGWDRKTESSVKHLIVEHGADPQSIDHTNSAPEDVEWVHRQLHAHVGDDAAAHHTNADKLMEEHPYWADCGKCGGDGIEVSNTNVETGEQTQKPCSECKGLTQVHDMDYWDSDEQLHDFANYPAFREKKIPDKGLKEHMKAEHGWDGKGDDEPYMAHQAQHGGVKVDPEIAGILLNNEKEGAKQKGEITYERSAHQYGDEGGYTMWAHQGGKPVGFMNYFRGSHSSYRGSYDPSDDSMTVHEVYVHPAHRRQGIASGMFKKMQELHPGVDHGIEYTNGDYFSVSDKGRKWINSLFPEDAESLNNWYHDDDPEEYKPGQGFEKERAVPRSEHPKLYKELAESYASSKEYEADQKTGHVDENGSVTHHGDDFSKWDADVDPDDVPATQRIKERPEEWCSECGGGGIGIDGTTCRTCNGYGHPVEASTKEAVQRTRAWFLKQKEKVTEEAGGEKNLKAKTIHTLPDGFTVKHLETIGDAHYEGSLMKNCIKNVTGEGCTACGGWMEERGSGMCDGCNGGGQNISGVGSPEDGCYNCDGSGRCQECKGEGQTKHQMHEPIEYGVINENLDEDDDNDWVDHHTADGYPQSAIYSLRDKDDIPQASFVMKPYKIHQSITGYDDDEKNNLNWEVTSAFGRTNTAVKPEHQARMADFFREFTKDKPGTHSIEFNNSYSDDGERDEEKGAAGHGPMSPEEAVHVTHKHDPEGGNIDPNCRVCTQPELDLTNPGNSKYPKCNHCGSKNTTNDYQGSPYCWDCDTWHDGERLRDRFRAGSAGDTTDPTRVTQTPDFLPPTPRGKDPWQDLGDNGLPLHNPALKHKLKREFITDEMYVGPTEVNSPGNGLMSEAKLGMADRTGHPEVDKAIEDFLDEPMGDWTTDNDPIRVLSDPERSHGNCAQVAEQFADFAKARGLKAYATDTDMDEMGYKPTGEPHGEVLGDDGQVKKGFYHNHTVNEIYVPGQNFPYTVDFTASQYGYTDHPKTSATMKQCMDCGSMKNYGPFQTQCPHCGGKLETTKDRNKRLDAVDPKLAQSWDVADSYYRNPDHNVPPATQGQPRRRYDPWEDEGDSGAAVTAPPKGMDIDAWKTLPPSRKKNYEKTQDAPADVMKMEQVVGRAGYEWVGEFSREALFDSDPFRDVSPSGSTAPAPSAQGQGGDPWPDQGDNGTAPPRPGFIFDPNLKKWIQQEQLTYPGSGVTFPGVTDINKVGDKGDVGAYNWVRWTEDREDGTYMVTAASCPKHKREKKDQLPDFDSIRTHGVKQCYFCGKSGLANEVKLAQAVPQQRADFDADNGIDGPLDRPKKNLDKGLRAILDGQEVAPDNAQWNVSIDNQNKTGAVRDMNVLQEHLVRDHYQDPEAMTNEQLYNDGELEELHIYDHANGNNTHNPEVLKVAKAPEVE